MWPLVEAIGEAPDFLNAYWGPDSDDRRRLFFDVTAAKRWVDFNTCKVILEDFGKTPTPSAPTAVTGPVTLVFGAHNILVDATTADRSWRRYFPLATTRLVNAGHFVHLEAPPWQWFPDS